MRSLVFGLFLLGYIPVSLFHPFFGALMWTWVSIMSPQREVFGFTQYLPVAMLIGVATMIGWVMSREPKRIAVNSVSIAFFALLVLSTMTSALSLVPDLAWHKWDLVMKSLVMSILTLSMMTSKVRIHALVWILCMALGYYGAKGGGFSIVTGGGNKVFGPASTYIEDNNHLGLALIMVVPLINYLRLHTSHKVVRTGLLITMLLTLAAAIFTFSRGALVGLVAMGSIIWWRSRQKGLMTLLVLFAAGVIFAATPDTWKERMGTIQSYDQDASAMSRIEIWMAGLKIVADRPIVGGGFRATHSQAVIDRYSPGANARAVHNSHLEILIEHGIFGFLIHLVLIGSVIVCTVRTMRRSRGVPELAWAYDLSAMLQAALVAYLVGGSFLSLAYYDGWWYMPMIAVATYRIVAEQAPLRRYGASTVQLSRQGVS